MPKPTVKIPQKFTVLTRVAQSLGLKPKYHARKGYMQLGYKLPRVTIAGHGNERKYTLHGEDNTWELSQAKFLRYLPKVVGFVSHLPEDARLLQIDENGDKSALQTIWTIPDSNSSNGEMRVFLDAKADEVSITSLRGKRSNGLVSLLLIEAPLSRAGELQEVMSRTGIMAAWMEKFIEWADHLPLQDCKDSNALMGVWHMGRKSGDDAQYLEVARDDRDLIKLLRVSDAEKAGLAVLWPWPNADKGKQELQRMPTAESIQAERLMGLLPVATVEHVSTSLDLV